MKHFVLKKPVVLIGMMGSGKSTVGKRIAHRLNLKFYDSDQIIEEREGLSVLDIYEYKGEKYFQEKEKNIITEILNYGTIILSTGGNSFLIEEIRNFVREKAITIYLKANVDTLHERISRRNTRPQFIGNKNQYDVIKNLLENNEHVYEQADITINIDNMEAHFIVDAVISKLKAL